MMAPHFPSRVRLRDPKAETGAEAATGVTMDLMRLSVGLEDAS